mgnify:CR=1 FL=1
MSTSPDFSALAERFIVKESVIENLFEEYELEMEAFGLEISFFEYLVEEFAQDLTKLGYDAQPLRENSLDEFL